MINTVFPVANVPEAFAAQFVSTMVREGETLLLDWDGRFSHEGGLDQTARFGDPVEALQAGRRLAENREDTGIGEARVEVRIWPALHEPDWKSAEPWWLSGEALHGGIEPGSWPYQVCRGHGQPGRPYETVAGGIMNMADAHLIRSAPLLRDALGACLAALAMLDKHGGSPEATRLGAIAHRAAADARTKAAAALMASEGLVNLTPEDLADAAPPGCQVPNESTGHLSEVSAEQMPCDVLCGADPDARMIEAPTELTQDMAGNVLVVLQRFAGRLLVETGKECFVTLGQRVADGFVGGNAIEQARQNTGEGFPGELEWFWKVMVSFEENGYGADMNAHREGRCMSPGHNPVAKPTAWMLAAAGEAIKRQILAGDRGAARLSAVAQFLAGQHPGRTA